MANYKHSKISNILNKQLAKFDERWPDLPRGRVNLIGGELDVHNSGF
jgi:hypothetical protein